MASNSGRRSSSSGRPGQRRRVVIGAKETVRVRYDKNQPKVEAERKSRSRSGAPAGKSGAKRTVSPHARRVSAAKKEARERRQRIVRARLWVAGAGVVAVVALLVWAVMAIYNAPVFVVKTVTVTGAERLSADAVRDLAAIPKGATLLRLPSDRIIASIESDPWISSVVVEKDFPSTVVIKIRERAPSVVVDAGGTDLWMVSSDGVWLAKSSKVGTDTVVVRDLEGVKPSAGERTDSVELLNAIKVIAGISTELRDQVRAVSAPTVDKTVLITDEDVEIFVGAATQLERKDRIARSILAKHAGKVVYINVRVAGHETWRGLESGK